MYLLYILIIILLVLVWIRMTPIDSFISTLGAVGRTVWEELEDAALLQKEKVCHETQCFSLCLLSGEQDVKFSSTALVPCLSTSNHDCELTL